MGETGHEPLLTVPEDTQPGGASDRQGPLIAAWNACEAGSTPLACLSWPLLPSGSGNFGTPWARMHLAKGRLKVAPTDRFPDPPDADPPDRVTGPLPWPDPPEPALAIPDAGARVWDEAADPFSQAVRTTISRLRAKLGDPPVIGTVPKAGYRTGG
jgi:hypothetical protein